MTPPPRPPAPITATSGFRELELIRGGKGIAISQISVRTYSYSHGRFVHLMEGRTAGLPDLQGLSIFHDLHASLCGVGDRSCRLPDSVFHVMRDHRGPPPGHSILSYRLASSYQSHVRTATVINGLTGGTKHEAIDHGPRGRYDSHKKGLSNRKSVVHDL